MGFLQVDKLSTISLYVFGQSNGECSAPPPSWRDDLS